ALVPLVGQAGSTEIGRAQDDAGRVGLAGRRTELAAGTARACQGEREDAERGECGDGLHGPTLRPDHVRSGRKLYGVATYLSGMWSGVDAPHDLLDVGLGDLEVDEPRGARDSRGQLRC